MNYLQSLAGVVLAGAFLVLFAFADANGAKIDSALSTVVVTTLLTGGAAFDAGRAVERRRSPSASDYEGEDLDPND